LPQEVRGLHAIIDRGARSGIGIAVFEQGGLIVDGGRGVNTQTPPVIARLDLPEEWRFLLVLDPLGQGLHGSQEVAAFAALPPFPREDAAQLCHLLLMRALPGLVEHDLQAFGSVISEIQRRVGDHFAPAQGGRYTSTAVAEAMAWLEAQGASAIGQSSWGPTGFCLLENETRALALLQELTRRDDRLQFRMASPQNCGAEICVHGNLAHATPTSLAPLAS
jgi:beta-RFAP synthase